MTNRPKTNQPTINHLSDEEAVILAQLKAHITGSMLDNHEAVLLAQLKAHNMDGGGVCGCTATYGWKLDNHVD